MDWQRMAYEAIDHSTKLLADCKRLEAKYDTAQEALNRLNDKYVALEEEKEKLEAKYETLQIEYEKKVEKLYDKIDSLYGIKKKAREDE